MTEERKLFTGELRLGRDLARSSQVLVRSLAMIMGLVYLLSDSVFMLADTRIILAALLLAAVQLFTLPNIFELLGGSGERGDTFMLIKDTLGNPFGFAAGWSMLAGYAILAASQFRSAAIILSVQFEVGWDSLCYIGAALLGVTILMEVFQIFPRRKWILYAVILSALLSAVAWLSTTPTADIANLRIYQYSSTNFLQAVALLMITYSAIEEILSLRYRIREPERHLQPSVIITGIATVILFLSIPVLLAMTSTGMLPLAEGGIAEVMTQAGLLPRWLVRGLGVVVFIVSADLCLMTAVRQFQRLILAGAIPGFFNRKIKLFRLPPLIFIFMAAIITPALISSRMDIAINAAAGFFLVPIILVNVAAIYSRQNEPERRRPFKTPFFPMVPAIGIALTISLFLAVSSLSEVVIWGWIAAGLLYYAFYARPRMLEAQEGVLVFRREPHRPKAEGTYRILVPLSAGVERQLLLELATALAHGLKGEVIPLQVIPVADPLAVEEGKRLAYERNTLFQWSTRDLARSDVIMNPITRLARSVPEGILGTAVEEDCDLILLSWSIHGDESATRLGRILDPVVRGATCDLAVIAFQSDHLRERAEAIGDMKNGELEKPEGGRFSLKRILVPTAGGPHAPLAMRLALILAREYDATTHSVYVTGQDATPEEIGLGEERIVSTLACMRREAENLGWIDDEESGLERFLSESRVVKAESVVAGITAAAEDSDLLLIGASEETLLDQFMFGTLPEQVARASSAPVAMVKRYQGLRRFWIQRLWDALFEALPTLSVTEQIGVYKEIHRQARPDIDFFIMMGLSALIATFGLLQNSIAVIIGAMLVAPLFTPLLATSMGIVLGNIRLLRLAIEAAVKGIGVAIGVATIITALSPLKLATVEIMARTQPNLFDLAVALASGVAGAYAVARKDVATSLPGVAIAAALVPPLSVIGIGLAMGDMDIAGGGTLLFATNLIAIAFSGAITFLLLGFRPASRRESTARLRAALISSILVLVVISIPLASVFISAVHDSSIQQVLDEELAGYFDSEESLEFVDFSFTSGDDGLNISIRFYSEKEVDDALGADLQQVLSERLGDSVSLHMIAIPVTQIDQP